MFVALVFVLTLFIIPVAAVSAGNVYH